MLFQMYRSFPNSFWSDSELKKIATKEAIDALVEAHYLFKIKVEFIEKGKIKVDGGTYMNTENKALHNPGFKDCYGLGPNSINIIYAHRLQILTYWIIALTVFTTVLTIFTIFET